MTRQTRVQGLGWALALAVGCGDGPASSGGATMGGTSTGSSEATSTQGPPTTSAGQPTTGTGGGASASATDSSTPTGGPTGSDATGGPSDTGDTAGDTAGETTGPVTASASDSGTDSASSGAPDTGDTGGAVSASSGEDSSSGSSSGGGGGCKGPADCPPAAECAVATCEAQQCGVAAASAGTPCAGGLCDGGGACVQCLGDADCGGQKCVQGLCVAPACDDQIKNGGETDVDCGGGCPGCANGKSCAVNGDCASQQCTGGLCVAAGPACAQAQADPVTGQRCPLFMPCTQSAQCGVFVGCQQWFCNNAKTCELNALVDCWTNKGGQCVADVVFTQQAAPPVDKRFVPPDNVNFREVASLAFTVKNNTASDLHLDKLPLVLDVMGGGSKFDVSSVKIFDNSGGTEHGGGDILVCLTADPFSFPANGVMGPCGGSAFSKVLKGQSNQFIVNLAFAKEKTFISGRSYRLRLASTAGVEFKVGLNGPVFNGSMCGVPGEGFTGAWVTGQTP